MKLIRPDQIPETVEKLANCTRELANGFELMHQQIQAGKKLEDGALEEAIQAIVALHRETRNLQDGEEEASYMKRRFAANS